MNANRVERLRLVLRVAMAAIYVAVGGQQACP
jgi:hypothetical protein